MKYIKINILICLILILINSVINAQDKYYSKVLNNTDHYTVNQVWLLGKETIKITGFISNTEPLTEPFEGYIISTNEDAKILDKQIFKNNKYHLMFNNSAIINENDIGIIGYYIDLDWTENHGFLGR